MRKNYVTPETESSLVVMAQSIICASGGPAPSRSGSIGTMNSNNGDWY